MGCRSKCRILPASSHPLAADYEKINVAVEGEDASSTLELTRALLALRRDRLALNRGSYQGQESDSQDCFVYLRQFEHERLLVAINFSEQPQVVKAPTHGGGQILLSTSLNRGGPIDTATLELQGHEGCIIELLDDI